MDLECHTRAELLEIAKNRNVVGRHSMNKLELCRSLTSSVSTTLTARIPATPAAIRRYFLSRPVQEFAKAPFVNGEFRRVSSHLTVLLRRHSTLPSARRVAWNDVRCREESPTVKATPCTVGTSNKLFFRRASTLGDYIRKLRSTISAGEHDDLWRRILARFRGSFVNHNEDVLVLHFKGR